MHYSCLKWLTIITVTSNTELDVSTSDVSNMNCFWQLRQTTAHN